MTVGAEQGEIAEVGSPVDMPGEPAGDDAATLRWTSVVIATAAAFLAMAGAPSLTAWLDARPPNPLLDPIRPAVGVWDRAMTGLHMDIVRSKVRKGRDTVRALRFAHEQPGEAGES